MTDAEFEERLGRYKAHMTRFRDAHASMKDPARSILVGLEMQERWPQYMGPVADLLPPEQP